MKRLFMALALCLACLAGRGQFGTQFENRGFEEWANFGNSANTIEPLHWHSTMSADGSFTGFLSQQMEPSNLTRPGSSGSKSARIWANSVLGIIANGNLTNGRMHAGSMTPSGSNNYVYTQRADNRFNTPISVVPDSLTAWVCFRCSNPYQTAQLRAIIHGDADLKAMATGALDPENQVVATALTTFTRTSEAGVGYQWRRITVPFNPNGPCDNPRYILFSATTNNVPGEGATSDELFLDDVLLVYRPSIEMEPLAQNHFVLGESITIAFQLQGTMSPENLGGEPNQVIAQLSASNGSFNNPTELGRMVTNTGGTMNVQIPTTIPSGNYYRIRLVTTNYLMVGPDNGHDLTIESSVQLAENHHTVLTIFPNPAQEVLHFSAEEEIHGVTLYSLMGEKVLLSTEISKNIKLPIGNLTPGVYVARCKTGQQEIIRKVIVQ